MKTTITCLGHGGAFSPLAVGNTSFLVECDGKRILVDCGTTVPESLKEIGVDPGTLDVVIVTHPHADHVGGLERLLYHRHYISKAMPLQLIMGWRDGYDDWDACVKACKNDLDRHVDGHVRQDRDQDGWHFAPFPGLRIHQYRVNHGGDVPNMNCYAFRLTMPDGSKLFFSGDRIWDHPGGDEVIAAMCAADLAFHEIELSPKPSGAHTHYSEIKPGDIGYDNMRKIRWVHHGLHFTHEPPHDLADAVKLAYKGDRWTVEGGKFKRLNTAHPL
jgi:ribonuclease BN (tRNA processing enzyme)